MKISFLFIFVFVIFFNLIFPGKAHAYLDPGSSSFILQLIIGVLVGAICMVKLFWTKIKLFFKNLFSKKKQ
ncbi:MAG: hypothetical protein ISS47_00735 [Candidatus Omnitrophica bacterium]|nr:hypothetical protein [Candidatus Omnitrophota bacterium]